jgi:hypothetical protein
LFLLLIIVYLTIARLFIAFQKQAKALLGNFFTGFEATCNIQGLKREISAIREKAPLSVFTAKISS